MSQANCPIGVFDSGIGGMSVLQALRQRMPHERFVYFADSAHAPYGEKPDDAVHARTLTVAQHLVKQHAIKALVVACNTATAAAIHTLRSIHPKLIVVGLEPALKPAIPITQTGRVAVMATRSTVNSLKFATLLGSLSGQAEFAVCACDGLALAIEQSTRTAEQDCANAHIQQLLEQYTAQLGPWGALHGQADTLVLGCTHYVFAQDALQAMVGPQVRLIHTGEAVAIHTQHRLADARSLHTHTAQCGQAPAIQLFTTGEVDSLRAAAQRWLDIPSECCHHTDSV
jgi:glutamate racemase